MALNSSIIERNQNAQWVYYSINEDFREKNGLLLEFLMTRFAEDEVFTNDMSRYDRFKKNNLGCDDIEKIGTQIQF